VLCLDEPLFLCMFGRGQMIYYSNGSIKPSGGLKENNAHSLLEVADVGSGMGWYPSGMDKYGLEMRAPRGGGCVSSGFLPTLRASRLLWLLRTDELMAVGLWLTLENKL